jgi:hypothetical protein
MLHQNTSVHSLMLVRQLVPKDPFLEPEALLSALSAFQHQGKAPPADAAPAPTYLTPALLHALDAAFDKGRQSEAYKVHKVLRSKLDDLATDLRADAAAPADTRDLAALAGARDGAPSLAWLWAGRPRALDARLRELGADGEPEAAPAPDPKSTDEEGDVLNAMPWSNRMQRKIGNWAGCAAPACVPCASC